MTGNKAIKSAMESMMFTWGEPLEAKMAADVFNITKEEAYECFKELQAEYEQEGRGIVIREVNKAFQFVTREENADYVRRLCTPVKAKMNAQLPANFAMASAARCPRVYFSFSPARFSEILLSASRFSTSSSVMSWRISLRTSLKSFLFSFILSSFSI